MSAVQQNLAKRVRKPPNGYLTRVLLPSQLTVSLPACLIGSAIISFFARFKTNIENGIKTETRRVWPNQPKFLTQKIALEKGLFARAWCGAKGNQIGFVRYVSFRRQRLEEMSDADVAREGYPGKSVSWFLAKEFEGVALTTEVWVVTFVFIPLHPC